jgi:hypothetical protein
MKFKFFLKNILKLKIFLKKEERKHIDNISRHKHIQKNNINTKTKKSTSKVIKVNYKKKHKKNITNT